MAKWHNRGYILYSSLLDDNVGSFILAQFLGGININPFYLLIYERQQSSYRA